MTLVSLSFDYLMNGYINVFFKCGEVIIVSWKKYIYKTNA